MSKQKYNRTYKKVLTKRLINVKRLQFVIFWGIICALAIWTGGKWASGVYYAPAEVIIERRVKVLPIVKFEANNSIIREVTAYNVGIAAQTDDTPCISANGENICEAVKAGFKRCAANFVPLGSKLKIANYGECLVTDRLNRRFVNRVDIAMASFEKERAINFGLQKLLVEVVK